MQNSTNSLFIISGPSGSGQDSVIEELARKMPIERVITTTTREKRMGEADARPYYFISKEEFEEGTKSGRFFEWAQHYNDNYYGVEFKEIERVQNSGKVGIWKIDKKGVEAVKKLLPSIQAILLYAPIEQLERRIRTRDMDASDEYVADRMAYSKEWLENTEIYDFKVLNEDGGLEKAVEDVLGIITGKV